MRKRLIGGIDVATIVNPLTFLKGHIWYGTGTYTVRNTRLRSGRWGKP